MVRFYISDIDPHFVQQIRKAVAKDRCVEVIGQAADGRRTLEDIQRLRPDVLLTDIPLPGLDGLAILRATRRLTKPPAVIICTRFYSTGCMEWAYRYGAAYFLCKPIDCDHLPELILDCAAQNRTAQLVSRDDTSNEQRAARVRALLTEIGISQKLKGCGYLVEAVLRVQENDLLLRNLSHGLYGELANRMGTTVSRVERALRSAICIAYDRGSLGKRFPRRPTNKEFIEYLARETE